jgi:hypothetical protein
MRFFLQFVLPFLAPTLLFIAWAWMTRHQAAGGWVERMQKGPWFWLVLSGMVLVLGGLGVLAVTGGGEPGSRIIAPYLEDGRVVPAEIK